MAPMDRITQQPVLLTVSIVIFYSAQDLLQRTLRSVYRSAHAARSAGSLGGIRLYLVNNTPDPGYREQINQLVERWPHHQDCPLVYREPADNRGFGAGNNSVLSLLDSDYHLVLNPDVELAEDALALGLQRMASEPDIVLLSPGVWGPDGEREYLCKQYPSVLVLLLRGFAPALLRRAFRQRLEAYEMRAACSTDDVVSVPLASGCFMLLRTAALRRVGGFGEGYFLYFEDFDLSIRLSSQGRVAFDPQVRIVHHGGYAARKGWHHRALFVRSALHFFREHGWRWI